MKTKADSVGVKLANMLDLPLDTVVEWPRIIINANQNVAIQNHRGVIEYDQKMARVNTKLGELVLNGEKLTLLSALPAEVVVEGKIERLELVDWR
jgi:sporulation protein YqfC